VIGCILISFSFVYIMNKRAQRIYQADMSLLLKDDQVDENSAALLYQNGLMATKNSLSKDEYLLTSSPLVYSVLKKLEFDLSFYRDDYTVNAEVYPKVPVKIIFETGNCLPYETPFYFMIKSDSTLVLFSKGKNVASQVVLFNNQVTLNDCKLTFFKSSASLQPYKNKRYAFVYHDLNSLTKNYQNTYSVKSVNEDINVLLLNVLDGNPQKAIDFLSEISNTYIQNNMKQKTERADRGIHFIKEQLSIVSDSLLKIESQMQHTEGMNNSDAISQQGERLFTRLEDLEANKSEIKLARIYLDTLVEYLRPNRSINELVMPSAMGLTDPVLNSRVMQLVDLQVEKKKVDSSNFKNPFYEKLNAKIGEEKVRINEILKNIQAEKKIEENEVNKQIETVNQSINKLPLKERQFISIQRRYASTEALYTLLNSKLAEVSITKASSLPDFEIINPPSSNNISIAPNFLKNYVLAFFFGLSVSIGFLFLTMLLSTTIESVTDIKKITAIPLLGVIGKLMHGELILSRGRKSIVGESFRSIRSKLHYLYGDQGSKVYLVTSCFCGEGKTFCSMNLAIVHAFSGKKTLLVSTDLRKHHTYNGLIPMGLIGLSDYLSNPVPLEEVIQPTKIENLFIIGTGKLPDNPSELLAGPKASVLMNELRKDFEIIILDTPPLGIISDAMSLLPFSDSKILVVRHGYTHKNLLEAVDEMCASNNLDNINIIFNDVKFSKLEARYGYYYGNIYGYEYQDSDRHKKSRIAINV
ncbi:MAG TPA: polysaccharide biosynthesis tyrosine autokinase, partial [Cyclobacteriaceae bacterium]|nr:polysaccharide biosynthesis tyrosine autokinase [Cyclobacteriaceae bacterium]